MVQKILKEIVCEEEKVAEIILTFKLVQKKELNRNPSTKPALKQKKTIIKLYFYFENANFCFFVYSWRIPLLVLFDIEST